MALFKILKGLLARLPNASKLGYAYYTTDKGKFYIFNSETLRRTLNPDIKITIGNQTKTSTTLSPEVAFDLASIGAAAAGHNHDDRYLKLSGGTMTGDIIFTNKDANRLIWTDKDKKVSTTGHYATSDRVAINSTSEPGYNFYVNGSTYLNGILNVASTLQPTSTNTQTLGTSSSRWAKVYIGTADTYGSTTKGVYWNAGVPTAMTYELKSTVNNGTATSIAYYSGTNVVSSGSIVTDGSYLHDVSSLYVTGSITANGTIKAGSKLRLWTDELGGNIDIIDNSSTRHYQFDAFNGNLRLYSQKCSDDSGYVVITLLDTDGNTTLNNIYGNHINAGGSLWISQNNVGGGGIHLADDGGFYDFNNGYGTAAFSSGLIVARGKDQNNTAISLSSEGRGWAYSSSEAQFGVKRDSAGDCYLFANDASRGVYSSNVGAVIRLFNDNTVHMYAHTYHNRSDIRLKQNIFNLKLKLSVNFIRLLLPVKFQFKHTDKYCFGFIAQDVLKVMKNFNLKEKDYNLVTKPEFDPNHPENERYYNISYTELIAPTIKAVQYLDKLIEQNKQKEKELQQLILKLKSLIQLLNAKLDTLVVSHL